MDGIQQATGREVVATPVAFGAILKRNQQPAPVALPAKRAHIIDDVRWRAAERGLPFTGPPVHPFNPLPGLRLCLSLAAGPQRTLLALRLADAAWAQGRDLADRAVVIDVAAACGIDRARAEAQMDDAAIKQALIAVTDRAADSGVFGVPTFAALDAELHGDFAALYVARIETDGALCAEVEALDAETLAQPLDFTSLVTGRVRVLPRWVAWTQLFNHQLHHRGQVTVCC